MRQKIGSRHPYQNSDQGNNENLDEKEKKIFWGVCTDDHIDQSGS